MALDAGWSDLGAVQGAMLNDALAGGASVLRFETRGFPYEVCFDSPVGGLQVNLKTGTCSTDFNFLQTSVA